MNESPPPQPDFDGVPLAKLLLRTVRAGALATVDGGTGFPFASLVTVATDLDGSPLLLMSRLAAHTANLDRDPRASILLAQGGKGDPLAHPRLTVLGRIARTEEPRARARFLARQPKAKLYAGFADFAVWRMDMTGAHLNGGFARATTLSAEEIRTDLSGAEDLLAVEESAVAHMNEDHGEALRPVCDPARRRSGCGLACDRPRPRGDRSRGRRRRGARPVRPARRRWRRAAPAPGRDGAARPQHRRVTMFPPPGRPGGERG